MAKTAERYEALFDQIDQLALAGVEALAAGDLGELGELMNLNHGLLNALQLSTPELEDMIHVARRAGAAGAKLTGGGGGGSMIALCPNDAEAVAAAIGSAGYQTLTFTVPATGVVTRQPTRNLIVSSDEERLILVDSDDHETGTSTKSECHDGAGVLHRAFSVFVFNRRGELLIHQRHPSKRLWPNFWSNSCCSHPRAGENVDVAVHRRLEQELGLSADLHYVYKFEYVAAVRRRRYRTRVVLGLRGHLRRHAGDQHHRNRELALDQPPRRSTSNWRRHHNASRRGSNWSGRRCAARTAASSKRSFLPDCSRHIAALSRRTDAPRARVRVH